MAAESRLPETQRAVLYADYGAAEDVLKLVHDHPVAAPEPDEVVIKVAAVAINPVACKLRAGYIKAWPQTLPIVPGWDVAGTVVARGAEVSSLNVGDDVYSYCRPAFDMVEEHKSSATEKIDGRTGSHQEYVTVRDWKVARRPKTFSFNEAAAVPLAGLTAYEGLHKHGGLAAGQTVLILGASGGVGGFAVQFAKAAGATVIGTCSARNIDYVKSLGADRVVDYNIEGGVALALKDVDNIDLCFDTVGGDNTEQGIKSLRQGGKVVTIANGGALKGLIEAEGEERAIKGGGFLVSPSAENLAEIAALCDAGKVQRPKLTVFALDEVVKAHKLQESGRVTGKLILAVQAEEFAVNAEGLTRAGVVPDVIPADAPLDGISGVSAHFRQGAGFDNLLMQPGFSPVSATDAPVLKCAAAAEGKFYTILVQDPDAPTRYGAAFREFNHLSVVNVPGGSGDLLSAGGDVCTSWLAPGPPYGSGEHRYVFMVFEQKDGAKDGALGADAKATFGGRGGTKGYAWAAGKGMRLVAAGAFGASWDKAVDANHAAMGFAPPPPLQSPTQQGVTVSAMTSEDLTATGLVPDLFPADIDAASLGPVDAAWPTIAAKPLNFQAGFSPYATEVAPVVSSAATAEGKFYTVLMTDLDPPATFFSAFREFHHWSVLNCPGGTEDLASGGTVACDWLAPGAPYHSGAHRYVFLIFEQKDGGAKVDTEVVEDAKTTFGGRGGTKSYEWATGQGMKLVAVGGFRASWDLSVDQRHVAMGFAPPAVFQSPRQASGTVPAIEDAGGDGKADEGKDAADSGGAAAAAAGGDKGSGSAGTDDPEDDLRRQDAENSRKMHEWIVMAGHDDSDNEDAGGDEKSGEAAGASPTKEGWITKRGSRFHTWKDRFAKLGESGVEYFDNDGAGGLSKGKVYVHGDSTVSVVHHRHKGTNCFLLESHDERLLAHGKDDADTDAWVASIKAAIRSHKKK